MIFGIQEKVPTFKGSQSESRSYDKKLGNGTTTRSGATCPCCGAIMPMEYIRLEAQAGRMNETMIAVVVDGPKGKEYRLPTQDELLLLSEAEKTLDDVYSEIPFGFSSRVKGCSRQ